MKRNEYPGDLRKLAAIRALIAYVCGYYPARHRGA